MTNNPNKTKSFLLKTANNPSKKWGWRTAKIINN